MRTNPKSGPTASQVPRRGTSRSRLREDTAPSVSSEAAAQRGQSSIAAQDPSEAGQPRVGRDDIERLAYSYWEARGGSGGSAEEDWYRAEQELMALSRAVGRS